MQNLCVLPLGVLNIRQSGLDCHGRVDVERKVLPDNISILGRSRLNINSASASGTKLTDITQAVMLNPSYSCADNEFTQVLNNDHWYSTELKSVHDGPGEEYAVQSTPTEYTDVIW
jgi:hypothetical protein